jgi:hypothetical protein
MIYRLIFHAKNSLMIPRGSLPYSRCFASNRIFHILQSWDKLMRPRRRYRNTPSQPQAALRILSLGFVTWCPTKYCR